MPLAKVKHGLLEKENFYLTSPAGDFLGDGVWSRGEGKFTLKSGTVKRKLPYRHGFVIDVKKEAANLGGNSSFSFFIEDSKGRVGIKEKQGDGEVTDWRIIYYNRFIQIYSSDDNGITWENKGGTERVFEGKLYQGFGIIGNYELIITDYNIYDSPYITIQNFQPGTLARFTGVNMESKERLFNEEYECQIFLDRDTTGYIEVFENDILKFTSETIDFVRGDVFLFTEENIQLIHNEQALGYMATEMKKFEDSFIVKNAGDGAVFNVNITVTNTNSDNIKLSFDGETWEDSLYIGMLESLEEKEFWLKIIRDGISGQFCVKQFDIHIY